MATRNTIKAGQYNNVFNCIATLSMQELTQIFEKLPNQHVHAYKKILLQVGCHHSIWDSTDLDLLESRFQAMLSSRL